ncbi:hypothetical protein [Promicromonospora sp. NPDC090134]|uniref:hypothetical protein n=1 Tax=Promicromonospora sp. NPDC090134 TaxID=3364408 RepID=UPI0038191F9F
MGKKRALPAGLVEHPVATLNQGLLLPVLDDYLFEIFKDPAALAAVMAGEAAEPDARLATLREQVAEKKKEIDNLVGILASGVTSQAITASLVTKEAELKTLDGRLADAKAPVEAVDLKQLTKDMEIVGGSLKVLHRATDEERRDLYEALGVQINFDAAASKVVLSVSSLVTPGREDKSVRRGT